MTRRPLLTFFGLAFALPWAVWATALAEQAGRTSWHLPGALAFWIGLPLASFGAAGLTGGRAAVVDLLRRMVRVRVRVGWYALALLVTPALAALTACLATNAGLPLHAEPAGPATLAGAFAFNAWMWLLTEETAWRVIALPRLLPRFGALGANLLLGSIWAVWHLPLFGVEGSFQSRLPFVAFALSTLATSMLIGWVFGRTRGSVLVAALFHASADVTIGVTGVMTSGDATLWTFVGLQLAAALIAGWRLTVRGPDPEASATMER